MRIAIIGGSFDPIHQGHLMIAKTALKKLPIDRVWFMPTKDSPLKQGQSASFYHRCQMVSRAIRPYRHMDLCTIEGERQTISYTIDTVHTLKKRYPAHTFCWLIGDDQAAQFTAWKAYEQLLNEIPFYVFSREENRVKRTGFHYVTMPLIQVSSSQIRQGNMFMAMPVSVRTYIAEHALYMKSIVQAQLSEKRFQHSCSVAALSKELAAAHHLDADKAYLAGLLHDICKQWPYEKQRIWIAGLMPQYLSQPPAIWHGYLGSYYVKHILKIRDKEILSSIYYHVIGRNVNDYERIIFIADKLDPSRGYDSSKEIALCKQDLRRGYMLVKQQQEAYLEKEGSVH